MPRWVSKEGEWHPQHEHVVLPHLQGTDKEVYDGPDRAALFELHKEQVEKLGTNFKKCPEYLKMVRDLGFKGSSEYLEFIGYNEEEANEAFKKNASVVSKHELPEKVAAIEQLGGGMDKSGSGDHRYGGMGQPKEL